jgi:hypothetical protein
MKRRLSIFKTLGKLWCYLALASLACNLGEPEKLYTPEKPTQYTAEVQTVREVYVLVDEAGNVVDFGGPYAYGVDANMHYVLRFWDVGNRLEGHAAAEIFKVYSPQRITAINQELEEGMSDEQKADIYARSTFPSTEVKTAEMTFSGGPEGTFLGTNLETGKEIYGYMDWREKEWEMHVCFYYDVMQRGCLQDFLVIGEEPFYNWP